MKIINAIRREHTARARTDAAEISFTLRIRSSILPAHAKSHKISTAVFMSSADTTTKQSKIIKANSNLERFNNEAKDIAHKDEAQ